MKRFHFRHERLLKIKRQQKKEVEIAVSRSRMMILQCEGRIEEVLAGLDFQTAAIQNRQVEAELGLQAIRSLQIQMQNLREALDALEQEYRTNLDAFKKISIEVKTLESLRESQLAEHKKQEQSRMQLVSDENAQNRHLRKLRLAERGDTNG